MSLGRLWAGGVYGTSTGNAFLRLEGEDAALTGTLRINEPGIGLYAYSVVGTFDGTRLAFTGEPQTEIDGKAFGVVKATATLGPRGNLEGEWETDIGSAGTFILFPHDQSHTREPGEHIPDQVHTARHNFGAIEIDRDQIIALADNIQSEFTTGQIIITFNTDIGQSRFLNDFKELSFNVDRAETIKIFVQETEHGSGIAKMVIVEFGPQANWIMTQGPDEAWVLGSLEKLKRELRRFERTYTTNFKRLGFGINQLLFVAAIVYLPSLSDLRDRAILMAGIVFLMVSVDRLHGRYLPFAAIYLRRKPEGLLARVAPSILSWLIAATASIAATLLAGFLQGWLALPRIE